MTQQPQKAEPGWYLQHGQQRCWTGSEWAPLTQPVTPPKAVCDGGPGSYPIAGGLLSFLAAAFTASSWDEVSGGAVFIGIVAGVVGWVLLSIGIAATGVQVARR